MSDLRGTAAKLYDTFDSGKSADNRSADHPTPSPEDVAVLKQHQYDQSVQDAFEAHFGPGAVSAVLGVPRRKP